MSELIHMRQRIKAVGTIKKVTHAMRLISMASHAKLRTQRDHFEQYNKELNRLLMNMQSSYPEWHYPIESNPNAERHLAIIVGSQKGLCGNFNNAIVGFFARQFSHVDPNLIDTIIVGKKAIELLAAKKSPTIMEFKVFTPNTLPSITQKISDYLLAHSHEYQSLTLCAQYPKSFFVQRPVAHTLSEPPHRFGQPFAAQEPYHWEHQPLEFFTMLTQNYLQKKIYFVLLNSLIAEQAARFIAMDSSTRNAATMLDDLRIDYNKLRQAKITRELTDLVGSFF